MIGLNQFIKDQDETLGNEETGLGACASQRDHFERLHNANTGVEVDEEVVGSVGLNPLQII